MVKTKNNTKKSLKKKLIKLLNIHGVSGRESSVRNYLLPILKELLDTVFVDKYGNLLGDLKCGNGEGSTILLSAHMDTVRNVHKNRDILIDDKTGIVSSSVGALGADDRAGIAIILEVLKSLKGIDFNGHVKVAFSREEEIGCVGAKEINSEWYKDTDLAIVVDRRGNRDIVVGCYQAFCTSEVGHFMEGVSSLCNMEWQCVEGGVSDAMIFSENGINSINLSAGYMNEHTDAEFVVIDDMKDTVHLILQTFASINHFSHTFGEVEYKNDWVKPNVYQNYHDDYFWGDDDYYEELKGVFAQEIDDDAGDVYIYDHNDKMIIRQGQNEIEVSKGAFNSLINQVYGVR